MATSVLSLAALITSANLADGQQVKADEHNGVRRRWEQRLNKLLGAATDMQENYAGTSEPNEKRDGSIWYDETNIIFKGRKSSAWVEFCDVTKAYSQSLSTAGTETFKPGGAIDVNTTQVIATDPGGDLMTYAVPANTLSQDGSILQMVGFGTHSGANSFSFDVEFGSLDFATEVFLAAITDVFSKTIIVRTGAGTVKGWTMQRANSDNATAADQLVSSVSGSADLTVSQTLKHDTLSSDAVTQEISLVQYQP